MKRFSSWSGSCSWASRLVDELDLAVEQGLVAPGQVDEDVGDAPAQQGGLLLGHLAGHLLDGVERLGQLTDLVPRVDLERDDRLGRLGGVAGRAQVLDQTGQLDGGQVVGGHGEALQPAVDPAGQETGQQDGEDDRGRGADEVEPGGLVGLEGGAVGAGDGGVQGPRLGLPDGVEPTAGGLLPGLGGHPGIAGAADHPFVHDRRHQGIGCADRLGGHGVAHRRGQGVVLGLGETTELALLLGLELGQGLVVAAAELADGGDPRDAGRAQGAGLFGLGEGEAVGEGGVQLGDPTARGQGAVELEQRVDGSRVGVEGDSGGGVALVDRGTELGHRLDLAGRRFVPLGDVGVTDDGLRGDEGLGGGIGGAPLLGQLVGDLVVAVGEAHGEQPLQLELVGQTRARGGQAGPVLGLLGLGGLVQALAGPEAGHGHEDHGGHGDEGQQLRPDVGVSLHGVALARSAAPGSHPSAIPIGPWPAFLRG